MQKIVEPALVFLDEDLGSQKDAVIRALARRLVNSGRARDLDLLYADLLNRESKIPTGLPGGLAIPHCRSRAVVETSVLVARLSAPVDFGAKDGGARLVFMICAPEGGDDAHLKLLALLSRQLMKSDFIARLKSVTRIEDAAKLVNDVLEAAPEKRIPSESASSKDAVRIVAVTACPTGIAHTFMAAEALENTAKELGVRINVETQGSGRVVPLDPSVIARAQAAIFAVDVEVRNRRRFADLPTVQAPVQKAISDPKALIEKALKAAKAAPKTRAPVQITSKESIGQKTKRALLTGVSYMIPFVAAGGILIALGFMLAGWQIDKVADDLVLKHSLWNLPPEGLLTYMGALAFFIGKYSMTFLVPALSGYIAYGIADRPGIAPGFVVGVIAVALKTGYIGGLVGGLMAGVVAYWFTRIRTPRWLSGLMPVVIIPLIATLVSSGIMLLALGAPIAWLMDALNALLISLNGAGAIVLGIILGAMMCFDLGGPVNKVAYTFATAGLLEGSIQNQVPWMIMAAVMASGMVPPLGMALATVLRRKLFTEPERESGKSAWLLGAAFISEGAIPFAAADPIRVIIASMFGGAATGAISMAAHVTSPAPHGGIFVALIIGNLPMFIVSIVVGSIITALIVILLKQYVRPGLKRASKSTKAANQEVDV